MYFYVYVCACDDAWLLLLLMLSVRFCSCCCCYRWCYCHAIYNARLSLVVLLCAWANAWLSVLNMITTTFAPIFVNIMSRHQSSFPARNITILTGMHTISLLVPQPPKTARIRMYTYVQYIQKETAQQASHHLLLLFIRKYQQVCRHVAFLFLWLYLFLSRSMFALCNVQCAHCDINNNMHVRILCDTY